MKRHTETAESQSSYTNFAFLPYGEWASEFEKGETPLIIAVKLVQLVGMGKTHGLSLIKNRKLLFISKIVDS